MQKTLQNKRCGEYLTPKPCDLGQKKRLWPLEPGKLRNDIRNLVQHRAFEPSDVTRWLGFADAFLIQVCRDVFKVEFEDISPVDLVEDQRLRSLLLSARDALRRGEVEKCIQASLMAFQASVESILEAEEDEAVQSDEAATTPFGPALGGFLGAFGLGAEAQQFLDFGFGDMARKIVRAERMSFLLASGVRVRDYKHYSRIEDRSPVSWDAADAQWICTFVTDTMVDWQTTAFEPHVPAAWTRRVHDFLEHEGRPAPGEVQTN